MSQSSGTPRARKAAPDRPKKPYPDFPLYPHPGGYWAKKIAGQFHYFGKWAKVVGGRLTRLEGDTWREALEAYKDHLTGRTPRGGLLVKDLCNRFLTAKQRKVESGEIGARMFEEYKQATDMIVAAFGANRPVDDVAGDDFESLRARMAKRWGPVRLGNGITRVRTVFKYGTDNGLIEKAVRYGSEFRKPDKAVLRRLKAANGERMFEAADVRKLIDAAGPTMKAMTFLGLNCGFGNGDCGSLQFSHLDLERGWVNFARPKTGIPRRCPLWPETVAAIREANGDRPKPAGYAECGLVFLTERGTAFVRTTGKSRTDLVAVHFARLLDRTGLHREGIGFYTLRHVFRTIADGARDTIAADLIMGHADPSMAGHYRERVEDARLLAVVNHVRDWLMAGRESS